MFKSISVYKVILLYLCIFILYIYIFYSVCFYLILFVKCYLHAFRYCILGILGILYTFTFMYVCKAPESNFN